MRELENALAHAFVTCPGGLIGPLDLPPDLRHPESRTRICDRNDRPAAQESATPRRTRARNLDRDEIARLLDQCGGNRAEAARRLGIDRTTLWRRMKTLDML